MIAQGKRSAALGSQSKMNIRPERARQISAAGAAVEFLEPQGKSLKKQRGHKRKSPLIDSAG